eukprot:3113569-Rhodomonas_salina.5
MALTDAGSRALRSRHFTSIFELFMSRFFGGSSRHFLAMASEVAAGTEVDLTRGIVARVHDESHVNRCVPDGGKSRLSAMQVTAVRVFLTVESHGQ